MGNFSTSYSIWGEIAAIFGKSSPASSTSNSIKGTVLAAQLSFSRKDRSRVGLNGSLILA
jgi:hypothetical protein